MNTPGAARIILTSGLIAGVCDLTGAIVSSLPRGVTPFRILQAVGSGWLGQRSYQLGYSSAALGLASHFMIALGAATVFYLASRKLSFLIERPLISGILYGIAVYWFMQLVVLPLSAYPHKTLSSWSSIVIGNVVHMICVGTPIALITHKLSQTRHG